MKKKLLSILLSAAMILGSAVGCSQGGSEPAGKEAEENNTAEAEEPTDEKYKVVLITMDSTDQHWVSVDKGAKDKAGEYGNVEYKWMAPDKKDDAQQIERINNAIADGAQAIMIAANGPDAINATLEEAKSKGIKIIYVDSPAKVEAYATYATDNEAAGKIAGEEMIKALEKAGKKDGKIGIVNVSSATASTVAREKGFRAAFEGKDYEILETQYANGDAAKSKDIADNYITQGTIGIFGGNEGSTVGIGNAIKGSGKSDIVGVGFDKSDAILSMIKDGSIYCSMAQNPDVMGSKGMEAAIKAIKGEKIEEDFVDTGVSILNKEAVK